MRMTLPWASHLVVLASAFAVGCTPTSSGECQMPRSGHYAIGGARTSPSLYLLGDEWDAELGRIEANGQALAVDHIARVAGALTVFAGPDVYALNPTPDAQGKVQATYQRSIAGADLFDAVASQQSGGLVILHAGNVWCTIPAAGDFTDDGVANLGGYINATGVRGTCGTNTGATSFAIDVVVNDGSSTVVVRTERQSSEAAALVAQSSPTPGIFRGLSGDGLTLSDNAIYSASTGGIAKLRDTKLCATEGAENPFNGSLIAGLRSVE